TLFVTLEPCNHYGKTPPCTDAILHAGIRRVVFAVEDPGPESAGGARRLREAGVEVVHGVEHDAARSLNAAFFHLRKESTPFIALKLALSLDAKISRAQGSPTRVTGAAASAEVHRLRAGFDAILIGAATAQVDDPLLTVRGDVEPRTPPIRIVVDSALRISPSGRLARGTADAPLWVLTAEGAPAARAEALEEAGARVIRLTGGGEGVDLATAVALFRSEGVNTILCEGGGRLASALLQGDWVARLLLFYAPVFFGEDAVEAFPMAGVNGELAAGERWQLASLRAFGDDTLLTFDRAPRAEWD
ncbi:MAG: bifunctional diaminohydroxyphosphoribosylaminopyrimidine deaminase/5-amino-6-(5-phosphoribosylamino)uracil reductase RibD, partial [Longimicrobiales bacterium]